jgi:hypothetical protein
MEKLLLIGLISALPMAILGLLSTVTGNKFLGVLFYKLPSIIILVVFITYILKILKLA